MNKVKIMSIALKVLPFAVLAVQMLLASVDYGWGWGRTVRYV